MPVLRFMRAHAIDGESDPMSAPVCPQASENSRGGSMMVMK